MAPNKVCKISSFNCKGFMPRNYNYLRNVFKQVDFLLLQEVWLHSYEFEIISRELPNCNYIAKSSMNNYEFRCGRPFGGVAILWKKDLDFCVENIDTTSDRLCVSKVEATDMRFLLFNVYMPINNVNNNDHFKDILYEIISICLMYETFDIIIAGDFNCQIGNGDIRDDILKHFFDLLGLFCPTGERPTNIPYTYINSLNQTSLIDHFCLNSEIKSKIKAISALDDGDNLSDHLPIIMSIDMNFDYISRRSKDLEKECKRKFKIVWNDAKSQDISNYKDVLSDLIDNLTFPSECFNCSNFSCKSHSHFDYFYSFLMSLIESIELATFACIPIKVLNDNNRKNSNFVAGWNDYVKDYRNKSIFWHNIWKDCGRPVEGFVANIRKNTRRDYHDAIKYVRSSENVILRDKVASSLCDNNPKKFWKLIKELTPSNDVRCDEVDGCSGVEACNIFKNKYKSLYNECSDKDLGGFLLDIESEIDEKCGSGNSFNHLHSITSNMIKKAVTKLNKGKRDTHEYLFTDSFINGPSNLFSSLAGLFSAMLSHGFSGSVFDLNKFSPLVKNKRKRYND